MTAEDTGSGPKLTALSVADLRTILAKSGSSHVSEESIRADLEAGAPANADGTINLIHYAAWLSERTPGGH